MGTLERQRKFYKIIKFYDADFTGRLFTHKTKKFREKGVFYVRQNRKLTWKLANTINPYKLRRRRRTARTMAFLMKQRLKMFYRHFSERQLRRLFANVRHRERKFLKKQTSYVMRLLERRLDNAVYRTGFFKMSEVKAYIKKYGVYINGRLCKRLNKKLAVGDVLTFNKKFRVKQRFAVFLKDQYPFTKGERGFKSVWNRKGLRFNFKLGVFKAGNFLFEPRNFIFIYGSDLEDGQAVFFPFDFDARKIVKIYQAVK